jgi:zinc protease
MKKIYISLLFLLNISCAFSQTAPDRSKRPKPGPAPVISLADPAMYRLANGITVLVVENHKLPKVSATYSIDAGPVKQGGKAGVMDIMGQMLGEGTRTMTKAQFDEAIDQMGADISMGSTGGTVSALTRYFDKTFGLMAEALKEPALNQESFDKIKSQTLTAIKANEKNAQAIAGNVISALSYGPDHPYGEFATEVSVNRIALDDIKKAYAKYITPSRGYLTFVGDIKPEQAKALAEKAFGSWKGNPLALPILKTVTNPTKTEIDLIDVPNAVQSEITVTNLVSLPLSNADYFPILLANQILGGGAESRLHMNLREKHGFTYGSYSSIDAGRFQQLFKAQASVRNDKVDSAVYEMLAEIKRIRQEKITAEELQNAKALYNGNFALGMEDPARTASFASNILIQGLPKDFYRTYLQKINAVTADDVQRVARKYFNHDNTRVVVVGKAETVQAGLAKLPYSLKKYDRFALPVVAKAPVALNIKASDIIRKYIAAIGGEEELKKISSLNIVGSVSVQGMTLNMSEKKMAPNLELTEMVMGTSQVVVHEVFDGKTGYQSQMGQKKDMTSEEISGKKDEKGVFPQLFYNDGSYKMEVAGTASVSGNDAYKVKITGPSGNLTTQYYDVKSGLLLKEESTSKEDGQDVTQSIEYSDYRKVGAILLSFKNALTIQAGGGSQEINILLKEVKINEGVSAADFK